MSVLQTIYNKLHGKSKTNLATQKFGKTKEINLSKVDELNDEIDELFDVASNIEGQVDNMSSNITQISSDGNDFSVRLTMVKNQFDEITEALDDLGVEYPQGVQRIQGNMEYFKERAEDINSKIDENISELNFAKSQIKV